MIGLLLIASIVIIIFTVNNNSHKSETNKLKYKKIIFFNIKWLGKKIRTRTRIKYYYIQ
jgi:hypothetical protein